MTTAVREYTQQEILAGGVGEVSFEIVDAAKARIPLSGLLTLKATLFDDDTGTGAAGPWINNRNAQSILNANGGTVVDDGTTTTATLVLSAPDNPLVTAGKRAEWHVLFLSWTWSGGGPGEKEYAFRVRARQ